MKRIAKVLIITVLFSIMMPFSIVSYAATNIALGKPTFASSYYSTAHMPVNATDGSIDTIWAQGPNLLNGTGSDGFHYVAVDLKQSYLIDNIIIVTRRDDNQTYPGIFLQAANNPDFSDAVTISTHSDAIEFGTDWKVDVDLGVGFRYVRAANTIFFAIAELEVYGEIYDPNAKTISDFTDIKDTEYDGPAKIIDYLGFLKKNNNYEYGAFNLLTRAEATKAALKLINVEDFGIKINIFSDVLKSDDISGYLTTALSLGIISDAEKFRPDDYVTATEFSKMILYAMGYSYEIEEKGGYPIGVARVTSELEIMSSVDMNNNDFLNKGNAAIMLYNALNKARFSENTILLESHFKIKKEIGIVFGNSVTTLLNPISFGKNSVEINNKVYKDDSGEASGLLGQNCTFITNEDDEIVCIWPTYNKNKINIVSSADIIDVKDGKINYNFNNKTQYYTFSSDVDVIKNGVAYSNWTEDTLNIDYGHLELIDNNNDDLIDVIFLYKPELAVVNYIESTSDSMIFDRKNGTTMRYENLVVKEIKKDGKAITAGRIKYEDLALIYISDNGKKLLVNVVSNSKTATAKEISDKDVEIDGQRYAFSKYYLKNKTIDNKTLLEKSAIYFLDDNNEIVVVLEDKGVVSGETLGFVQKIAFSSGVDQVLSFKIFTQYGKFVIVKAAREFVVDGTKRNNSSYFIDKTMAIGQFNGKFISYNLNADGELSRIDTEMYNQAAEPDSKMKKSDYILQPQTAAFIAKSNAFFDQEQMRIPCNGSTLVFEIPAINGVWPEDNEYDKYYKISTVEKSFPNFLRLDQGSLGEFYCQDENYYPLFAVKYKPYLLSKSNAINVITDYSAAGMIVEKVSKALNSDGDEVYKISGFSLDSGGVTKSIMLSSDIISFYDSFKIQQEKPEWLDTTTHLIDLGKVAGNAIDTYSNSMSNLCKGDIVRYQLNGEETIGIERVFSYEQSKLYNFTSTLFYSTGTNPTYPLTDFMLQVGKNLVFYNGYATMDNAGNKHTFNYGKAGNLFLCDGERITKVSTDSLPSHYKSDSKVVLYISNCEYKAVIIY